MQKTQTKQELAVARRNNSIMLALLFTLIVASMVFAFGTNILYIIALFALPLLLVRTWEEVNRVYSAQKPQLMQMLASTKNCAGCGTGFPSLF